MQANSSVNVCLFYKIKLHSQDEIRIKAVASEKKSFQPLSSSNEVPVKIKAHTYTNGKISLKKILDHRKKSGWPLTTAQPTQAMNRITLFIKNMSETANSHYDHTHHHST